MSCQQAPRLTEDPYIFTETVPTTPVLFNPQKPRHQQQPKSVTQSNPPPQTSTYDTANLNTTQQYFGSRFNGTTTAIETPSASITQQQQIINGMQKNVISITTISNGNNNLPVSKKLTPHTQHSHQKIVTTAAVTVTPSAVASCSGLPAQVISWNQSQSSTVLPPAQHHLKQQNHLQQQSFFTLTSNCSSNVQSLACTPTLLPPSNFHQNTLAQQLQKVGSKLTNTNSVNSASVSWTIPQQLQQPQQQQYSKVAVYPHKAPLTTSVTHLRENVVQSSGASAVVTTAAVVSASSPISLSSDTLLATVKHSDFNKIPVSVIYQTASVKSEPGTLGNSGGGSVEVISTPLSSNALSSSPIRKSVDSFEKNVVFATPAKRDSRVLSSSAKKSLKGVFAGAPGKAKQSQSQTTHHEALQRISLITQHSPVALSSPSLSPSMRRPNKVRRRSGDWHAPDTYIFDSVSPLTSLIERRQRSAEKCDSTIASSKASCVQQHWLGVYDLKDSADISARALNIGREERIERHKALLRRQAVQLISSQEFLKPTVARSQLVFVSRFLQKLKNRENSIPVKKCCVPTCTNNALPLTAQCYIHITRNLDQQLFLPCTAKFSDNTQCRIPVFDISHELPLCREHGWKRDNYNRIVQEQRPKAKITRKRTKSSVVYGRPPKRSKKKRKGSTSSLESIASNSTTIVSTTTGSSGSIGMDPPILTSNCVSANSEVDGSSPMSIVEGGYTLKVNEINQCVSQGSTLSFNTGMDVMSIMRHQTQQDLLRDNMLSICENSSVYASSEDTGVGGLSESELMVGTQDAEEIPLGDTRLLEEHDLTNVLNNLPVDAFNELFTVVHQDEREEVERALELADKQIKSLQQMTGSDNDFLRDFLDGSDQILDDTDICTEIVSSHSPDTSGIDTSTLFVDGGSNSTTGSCTGPTPTDIRGLVQT